MCDITQFFVTFPISECTSVIIAQHFMQNILMKFGLYNLVVIDDMVYRLSVFSLPYVVVYRSSSNSLPNVIIKVFQ